APRMIWGLHPLVFSATVLVVVVASLGAVLEFRDTQRLYSLRAASRTTDKGFADLLVYASLIAPGVVLNKNGALMAGWRIRGEDPAGKSAAELAQRSAHLNAAFVRRDA